MYVFRSSRIKYVFVSLFQTDLSQPTGYPSILSHTASLQLIHPIYTLAQRQEAASQGAKLLPQFSALQNSLPCEVHLLNLRTLQNPEDDPVLKFVPKDTMALVLHRLGVDCAYPAKGVMCVPGSGKVGRLIVMIFSLLILTIFKSRGKSFMQSFFFY